MTIAQIPHYDSGFCYDAANAPDRQRLSGPASAPAPPTDWTSPGVSNTPWSPTDEGHPVDEWTDANGYTGDGGYADDNGYGAPGRPTKSWRYDVSLPSGWYTRVTTSKKHSGQQ